MNIRKAVLATGLVFGFAAAGCAPIVSGSMNAALTEQDVVEKTAEYFAVDASELEITNIEKHTLATTYRTVHDGTLYNCRVYYGAVECARPGG